MRLLSAIAALCMYAVNHVQGDGTCGTGCDAYPYGSCPGSILIIKPSGDCRSSFGYGAQLGQYGQCCCGCPRPVVAAECIVRITVEFDGYDGDTFLNTALLATPYFNTGYCNIRDIYPLNQDQCDVRVQEVAARLRAIYPAEYQQRSSFKESGIRVGKSEERKNDRHVRTIIMSSKNIEPTSKLYDSAFSKECPVDPKLKEREAKYAYYQCVAGLKPLICDAVNPAAVFHKGVYGKPGTSIRRGIPVAE